jgi:hypothetical protein
MHSNAVLVFDCSLVFNKLYKPLLDQVSKDWSTTSQENNECHLRTCVTTMVEEHFLHYFGRFTRGEAAVDIHRSNLSCFRDRWPDIQSNTTCLCCVRRRPQYGLPCGHCICENCVVVFGDGSDNDPWVFVIRYCFLCGQETPSEIAVRVHPPTAGAGVLCIDGGGTRGIVPLVLMKRIQDCIGLPIPLQRFIKVAFGVSIGESLTW